MSKAKDGSSTHFGRVPYRTIDAGAVANMTPAAAKVYLVLAGHVNGQGYTCKVGLDRLAELTGLSRRGVQQGIAQLKSQGAVEPTPGCGRGHLSQYELLIKGAPTCALPADKGRTPVTPFLGERAHVGDIKGARPCNPSKVLNREEEKEARRDEHAEAFRAAFNSHFRGNPYEWTRGDFVQLTSWRKTHPDTTPGAFAELARWHWGRGQYTPSASLTIKGLCAGWSKLAAQAQAARGEAGTGEDPDRPGEYGAEGHVEPGPEIDGAMAAAARQQAEQAQRAAL